MLTPIKVDNKLSLGNGDFGTRVADGVLFVSAEFQQRVLKQFNVRSAEQAYTVVHCFPTWVQACLSEWTVEEVQKAGEMLKKQLTGTVDDGILNPGRPKPFVGGVLPPNVRNIEPPAERTKPKSRRWRFWPFW